MEIEYRFLIFNIYLLIYHFVNIGIKKEVWMLAFGGSDASEEGHDHHQHKMFLTSYTCHAHLNYSLCIFVLISYCRCFSEVMKNSMKWDTRNANSGTAFKIIFCIILTSYEVDIILAKIVCNDIFHMCNSIF